jgi:hypothetical protein
MYRPLRVFTALGTTLVLLGMLPGLRFVYLYAIGDRVGHVQSLILAAILIITGFQVLLFGLLADLMHFNRRMQEELVYRMRRLEIGHGGAGDGERTGPDVPRHEDRR